MKKSLSVILLLSSFSAQADLQFNNLSKEDIKDISREFGANFNHTVIAAPETNGLWGVEVGLVAGKTDTPELKRVVENSGGKGSDVKNLYHLGLMARIHFPLELFIEGNFLPEQDFDSFKVKNTSYGVGWNAGRFFNLPLDVAFGAGQANSELSFSQTSPGPSTIKLETTTTNYWVGISRTFLFFTPYFKYGRASVDGDLTGSASVFGFSSSSKESVHGISGNFMTVGANLELGLFKVGLEASEVMDVKKISGKLALDF
jgi:hypothetical protein